MKNIDKIIKYLSGFNILHCVVEDGKLAIYSPETEVLLHFILHLLEKEDEVLENILISEPDLADVFSILEKKKEKQVIKENIDKLNKFVEILIGKKYSTAKIKEIMISHRWPKEIADALVGKRAIEKLMVDRK
jgi:hypothetical protein